MIPNLFNVFYALLSGTINNSGNGLNIRFTRNWPIKKAAGTLMTLAFLNRVNILLEFSGNIAVQ